MKKKTKKDKYEKPELKTIQLHADEVLVAPLSEAIQASPELIRDALGRHADITKTPYTDGGS